jgi:hypothetical protein
MPARKAAPKAVYRVRNWNEYNDALVGRGSLTLWVDQETLRAWRYHGPSQRGAQFRFSDTAIECLLTLRAVYRLTLRATEGFARSLFGLMRVALPVPDYTTLCRRAATVRVTLPKNGRGNVFHLDWAWLIGLIAVGIDTENPEPVAWIPPSASPTPVTWMMPSGPSWSLCCRPRCERGSHGPPTFARSSTPSSMS